MDEHAEVKKKRSWWVKSAIWLAVSVVFIVVVVLAAATAYHAHTQHQAQKLAEMPVPQRNLAIFDAARGPQASSRTCASCRRSRTYAPGATRRWNARSN